MFLATRKPGVVMTVDRGESNHARANVPPSNEAQIRTFINLIKYDGACFELRVLGKAQGAKFEERVNYVGFFDNVDLLVKAALDHHGKRPVYLGINPRKDILLHAMVANQLHPGAEGAKAGDVIARRWFMLDLDTIRPSKNVAASLAELESSRPMHDRILQDLEGHGVAPIKGMSGNGRHLLVHTISYQVELDKAGKDKWQAEYMLLLNWFQRRYGDETAEVDTSINDPGRIWKVYGTAAVKGGNTIERPWRTAKFEAPKEPPAPVDILQVYRLEIQEQREFEGANKTDKSRESQNSNSEGFNAFAGNLNTLDIVALSKGRELYVRPLSDGKHAIRCPWHEAHTGGADGDGSTVIFEAKDNWPGFKCSHSHCSNRRFVDFLDWFSPDLVDSFCSSKLDRKKSKSPKEFCFTRLGALLKEPDENIPWIVNGLLPSSGTSIIAAKAKVGKTTLARQLALAVAKGETFLGMKTERGPVIYIAVEEKRDEIKKHFRDMGAIGDEDIHVHVAMAPDNAIDKLIPIAKEIKPRLIVIDTLFRTVRVEDGNSYNAVIAALEPIQELARKTGAHVLSIHHKGKTDREGTDGMLGSMGIQGAFDTNIIMDRKNDERTIFTEQRYGKDMPKTGLAFDEKTRRLSLGQTVKESDEDRIGKQIWDYLKSSDQPQPETVVRGAIGGNKATFGRVLRMMVQRTHVMRSGAGKAGSPFLYEANPRCPPGASTGTNRYDDYGV